MAKKPTKKPIKKHEPERQEIDAYARVLQVVAVIAVVSMVFIDNLVKDSTIPVWIYFGILGVAVGLSPEQILDVIKSIFTGGRRDK